MVLGLMVGAKVDEYVERTEPGEFRVLEEGGEIVSLLRLAFAGGDGMSLTFPRQDKRNAESLAAALGHLAVR